MRRAAFKRRDTLLQHIRRQVFQARVSNPKLGQRKQACGMVGAVELIAGGLIDQDSNRAGCRVTPPTCM